MIRIASKSQKIGLRGDSVTIPRAEYERLLAKSGEKAEGEGPALPKPDARGNYAALDYIRASIARELIRRRRAAGLSQVELAARSGVRQETISRIETGKHTVTASVMKKLEQALDRVGKASAQRKTSRKQHTRR